MAQIGNLFTTAYCITVLFPFAVPLIHPATDSAKAAISYKLLPHRCPEGCHAAATR